MSIGIGAFANLFSFDEEVVIYEYGSYNLNDEKFRNDNHICDGYITISRNCFIEPEIHEKIKKMPSGRKKLITKKIPVSVKYGEMIDNGKIQIINCTNCWDISSDGRDIDRMVFSLLFNIFNQYQIIGEIPEHIYYNV